MTKVYANGMEIACQASSGKSVASFPDVCFTPPTAPPTPPGVPLPYPNTGMASDTDGGSKTVNIGGKPVMLKDKSYFKKSTGSEAGSAPKKGVVSSKNCGKVYFTSWSMNVKFEGENVVRHLDMTTHNHASVPGNTGPWPYLADMAVGAPGQPVDPCSTEKAQKDSACGENASKADRCANDECRKAMRCELQPYSRTKNKERGCCPGQTPHHLVEVHGFTPVSGRGKGLRIEGFENYNDKHAPCVCCDESSRAKGDHGSLHAVQGMAERGLMDPAGPRSQMGGLNNAWNYAASKKAGLVAHRATFADSGCTDACIEAQLDAYHKQAGVADETALRADRTPLNPEQEKFGAETLKKIQDAADAEF